MVESTILYFYIFTVKNPKINKFFTFCFYSILKRAKNGKTRGIRERFRGIRERFRDLRERPPLLSN